jgi:cation transporter-like permease
MSIRLRKFIGTVLLFALVIVWALVAMVLAQAPLIHDNEIASIAYYVIAGLGWVLPAMPIVSWMSASGIRKQVSGVKVDPDT